MKKVAEECNVRSLQMSVGMELRELSGTRKRMTEAVLRKLWELRELIHLSAAARSEFTR